MKKAKKDSELKIPAAIFNIFYPMDSRKRFYNLPYAFKSAQFVLILIGRILFPLRHKDILVKMDACAFIVNDYIF